MPDELATTNVGRTYSLAGVSITIFTFTLVFLYPRFLSGEVDPLLFQAALALMGCATFSFVFGAMYYYGASLKGRLDEAVRFGLLRQGDRLWLVGYTLLFVNPSLILGAVGLFIVAAVWFVLWLGYLVFISRFFRLTAVPSPPTDPPQSL